MRFVKGIGLSTVSVVVVCPGSVWGPGWYWDTRLDDALLPKSIEMRSLKGLVSVPSVPSLPTSREASGIRAAILKMKESEEARPNIQSTAAEMSDLPERRGLSIL